MKMFKCQRCGRMFWSRERTPRRKILRHYFKCLTCRKKDHES